MAAANQIVIIVPKPAAAADWSYTVSGFAFPMGLTLVSVSALFVASGNVANRIPALFASTGANLIGSFGINAALTAGQSARYEFGSGLPAAAAPVNSTTSPSTYPIPSGLLIPPGGSVSVVTAAIAAGDQWSDIVLVFSS